MPQQGMSVLVTSCAHLDASDMKLSAMPIFFEEHGTCTAMESRTFLNSSLLDKKLCTNSTGSYRANLLGVVGGGVGGVGREV